MEEDAAGFNAQSIENQSVKLILENVWTWLWR